MELSSQFKHQFGHATEIILFPFLVGKYIEATSIENKFTTFFSSGVLHDCVLIGEGMDRLLLLVSFKTIQDTDTLNGTVVSWCRKIGSTATKTGDLTEYKDKAVRNEILVYIGKVS